MYLLYMFYTPLQSNLIYLFTDEFKLFFKLSGKTSIVGNIDWEYQVAGTLSTGFSV